MTSVTQKMQSAARIAFVSSVETDSVKYNKAVAKLAKDWAETGHVSKVVEIACARSPSVSRFAFSSSEVKGHRLEGL